MHGKLQFQVPSQFIRANSASSQSSSLQGESLDPVNKGVGLKRGDVGRREVKRRNGEVQIEERGREKF